MQDTDAIRSDAAARAAVAAGLEKGLSRDLCAKVIAGIRDYAIFALDGAGSVLSWGEGARQLTGYDAAEVVGQPFTIFSPRADEAEVARALASARADGSWSRERWWRRREGGLVWVEELINPLDGDAFVVITRDLTERVEAEERRIAAAEREKAGISRETVLRSELQAAERRASYLAEASSILVATSLDFESTIRALARLAVSRIADWCVIHQLTAGDALRSAGTAHRNPQLDPALQQAVHHLGDRWRLAVRSVLQTGQSQIIDRFDLAAWFDDSPRELLDGAPGGSAMITPLLGRGDIMGAVTFISTGERNYEDEDLALAEELGRRAAIALDNARLFRDAQEASRAKADFLAVISHELRTPLNAIMGYSDLMDAEVSGSLTDRQRRQVDRIRASARHLLQLIEEILAYARMEAGGEELELGLVDARELVREAAAVTEPLAHARDLELVAESGGPPITMETDASKVRQVLVNLLSNAVKFTGHGTVAVRVEQEGESVVFHVQDTGIGIPDADMARVFDPFWQAERPNTRRVGGTGLGLSVSRRYARLLHGDIEIGSRPGAGTHVRVRLPLRVTGAR